MATITTAKMRFNTGLDKLFIKSLPNHEHSKALIVLNEVGPCTLLFTFLLDIFHHFIP